MTDSKARAVTSKDPRIPIGSHYGPFLGPGNTAKIKAAMYHLPAIVYLDSYKIDETTMVQAARVYITESDGGYTFAFWREKEIAAPESTVWDDPMMIMSSSSNSFIVDPVTCIIKSCAHPERAIINPIGVNICESIHSKYHDEIKTAIKSVMENGKPYPVEYKFTLAGETRHKIGYINRIGQDVQFNVRRITPQELSQKTG